MFDKDTNNINNDSEEPVFTPKDIKEKNKEDKPKKRTPKNITFGEPVEIKAKVLRTGKYRLDGKVYDLAPGDTFDAARLSPRKRDILVNTKFISLE